MTTLYLIRHGQTKANVNRLFQGRADNPLNETGIHQAIALAEGLKKHHYHFDVLYTSPLQRAQQTAEIIKKEYPSVPLFCDYQIIERDFGEGEGCDITVENYLKFRNNAFPFQESEQTIIKRIQAFLHSLLTDYPGKHVGIVCHSHVIKAFLIPYNNNITFETSFKNASVIIMRFDDTEFLDMDLTVSLT